MRNIKLFLLLIFLIPTSVFAEKNNTIHISNAWISEAPPNVTILAAYAKILNESDKDKTLSSISSPTFSMIELHLSKVVNGLAKMEKQSSLKIPAKSSIELSPGAYHLMLFNPESSIKAGDTADISFNFADGSSITVEAVVKKRMTNQHQHGHEHHHDHN